MLFTYHFICVFIAIRLLYYSHINNSILNHLFLFLYRFILSIYIVIFYILILYDNGGKMVPFVAHRGSAIALIWYRLIRLCTQVYYMQNADGSDATKGRVTPDEAYHYWYQTTDIAVPYHRYCQSVQRKENFK